jgi:hypothetical protein
MKLKLKLTDNILNAMFDYKRYKIDERTLLKLIEEELNEIFYIEDLQSVRARRKNEAREVGTKRKGKEATPERTSYDVGHCI